MSEKGTIRIGVIGAGWFASRRHLPDIQSDPRLSLTAICRRNQELLNRMGDHFGVSDRYTGYRRMLAECELDAVLVATPHNFHFEPARAALEQGLHVLVEKPLTIHVAEGRDLVALAEEKDLVLAVALNPPYWKHCHAVRSRLPEIGELETVEFIDTTNAEGVFGRAPLPDTLPGVVPPTLFRADVEANGGGNLIDGGSHLVSELLWCTGQMPVEVTSRMDACPADMRSLTALRLPNGALCSISLLADSRHPGKRVHHVYCGTDGSLYSTGWPFEIVTRFPEREPAVVPDGEFPEVPTPVGDFASAVLDGGAPLSPGRHALEVVSVIAAAYESAREGKPVVPETV